MTDLEILVIGDPASQGSKTAYVKGGRAILVESSPRLRPWRAAISAATSAACRAQEWPPLDAPVEVEALFLLRRPRSAPRRIIYPAVKPDLDKLTRALLDGIVDGGALRDDSRIVTLRVAKRYVGDPEHDYAHPGAHAIIRPM